MAVQDGDGVTNDSKETKSPQKIVKQQEQQLPAVSMSGGENSADAIQPIGGGSGGNGVGRGDSGGSIGSGPKTTSAVTTLVSNGSATQNNSNVDGSTLIANNNHSELNNKQNNRNRTSQESEEDDTEGPSPAGVTPRGFWGVYDRPSSRGGSPTAMDNMSEASSQPPVQPILPRSKSRTDMIATTPGSSSGAMPMAASAIGGSASNLAASGRITNQLSFWKARCITFYRNGDPFFNGLEFRFKPGRDISNLERLLDKISTRIDLPRGARYIFSMDGDRKYSLDELEDGASYVVSSYSKFKVSRII